MRKKPIESLELFYAKFESETEIADIIAFNSKLLKKLLKKGNYIDSMYEYWYDSEEFGLDFNNWIDDYEEGVWGMSQKDVEKAAKYAVREFSHLTRRASQKVIPRAYITTRGTFTVVYLYMRDRIGYDDVLFLRKRELQL